LRHNNKLADYMELLMSAFNPATIDGLMCRNTISVGWRGEIYDCDFNQQLNMQWVGKVGALRRPDAAARRPYHSDDEGNRPLFLWDIRPDSIANREIMTGDHCFGCTAGAGSSCGGAIV
jgi:Protein of unknown function (DUF3641)